MDSSLLVNCVFNVFLSYTATMLNIITIRALRKTSSLPKNLKTLLLSLAVSDLEQNVEETTTAAKLRKSMVGTFYVYLVFLACYLPYMLVNIVRTVKTTSLTDTLRYYALTLVFLNSSLNPLVYCWKMRQI
ncbi:unnamed protein product, partial [Porites lobata]